MRGSSSFAAAMASAAAVFVFGAVVPSARGAVVTFDLTFTPQYISIGGVDYPRQSNDGFSSPTEAIPAPQFSKITATIIVEIDGTTPHFVTTGSTVRLHDVHDPSIVTYSTSDGPDLKFLGALRPNQPGGLDLLELRCTGPVSNQGPGLLVTSVYFPSPFDGNGTAVMPNSEQFKWTREDGTASATYFMETVTATVVPDPASGSACAAALATLPLLLRRRRRSVARR